MADTPFRHRLWWASSVGTFRKMNGQMVSMPLPQRRPPVPFEPRITLAEVQASIERWSKP